jgi:hypothetical protein
VNGFVFQEIGKFVQSLAGGHAWVDLQRAVAPPGRIYYRVAEYPDEEALGLVGALAERLGEPEYDLLRRLGEFMVPDLLRVARYWVPEQWRSIDLIDHTESTIHEMLRQEGSQTDPPRLRTLRKGPDEVEVIYDSPRRLCALAKGIITGLGKQHGEDLSVAETDCMLEGALACRLIVSVSTS